MFKISIQSLKDYFTNKKKEGKQLLFHESIGDANTSKEEIMKNLVEVLEKNGFKYKGSKYKDK
tara:strand:- start:130 stop:318 length:189 start_codon:yes stop_codon:yes gene_type:complete